MFSGFRHQQCTKGSSPATDSQPLVTDSGCGEDVPSIFHIGGEVTVLVGGQACNEAVVGGQFQCHIGESHRIVVFIGQTTIQVLRLCAQHRCQNKQCHKE